MGSKFTHIHARARPAKVVDSLRRLARSRGYRLAEGDAPCDFEVVIASDASSNGWTSVYRPFGGVALDLSSALHARVLQTTVFDGDVLDVRLYNDGAEVDVFCSDGGESIERSAREVAGQPRRWDALCVGKFGWQDVKRVFTRARKDRNDPEGALVELGRLLGLDERSLFPDHLDPSRPPALRLRLLRPAPPKRPLVEGAPIVRAACTAQGRTIAFAQSTLRLSLSSSEMEELAVVESAGGASGRLEVALAGTALDAELAELAEVLCVQGESATGTWRAESDGRWFAATFGGLPAASAPAPGLWLDYGSFRTLDDGHRPTITLRFRLRPRRLGTGELRIRWTPLEPDATPFVHVVKVRAIL